MADNDSTEHVSAKGFGGVNDNEPAQSAAKNTGSGDYNATPGDGGGFVTGLLLGSALGALLAFLFAPQGGEETRGLIKQKTNDYSDAAKAKANGLSDAAKAKAAEISGKASDTADSAKAKANEVTDSVKAKAADLTAKATGTVASVKGSALDLAGTAKAVVEDQKSRVSEAVDAGKQAAQETKEQLSAQADMPVEHGTELATETVPSQTI